MRSYLLPRSIAGRGVPGLFRHLAMEVLAMPVFIVSGEDVRRVANEGKLLAAFRRDAPRTTVNASHNHYSILQIIQPLIPSSSYVRVMNAFFGKNPRRCLLFSQCETFLHSFSTKICSPTPTLPRTTMICW